MTIFTVGQSPIICSNMTEMGTLLTNYPDLEPMTACTVMSGAGGGIEVYRLQSGVWTRTYPDQATVDWLTQNSTDITTLQSQMGNKEEKSVVTALTNTVSALAASLKAVATTGSYNDLIDKPTIPPTPIAWVPASATRTLVTSTGAVGFRPSTTRNTLASYNIKITSTASIAGNADGSVVLEVCPTNSATAGDWIEIGRQSNSQVLSLAVVLNSVQGQGVPLIGVIPTGWYAKLRTITTTGTVGFTYVSGSETPMS